MRNALTFLLVIVLGIMSSKANAGQVKGDNSASDLAKWRAAISATQAPTKGCFKASYPNIKWTSVECVKAPTLKKHSGGVHQNTIGNANDYAAEVPTGLISQAIGSFPVVTGLKTEVDGVANAYSLQLNSNYMLNNSACAGSQNQNCQAWQQFAYQSMPQDQEYVVFMQYWLINYGTSCPTGWMYLPDSEDCYQSTLGVSLPSEIDIKQLPNLSLSASAVPGGLDTVTLTTATNAYSESDNDTILNLSQYWKAAEFNVFGYGDGTEAIFNTGTSLTVGIALTDVSTNVVPVCAGNAGTTGETNNLNLGACTVRTGATPSISFIESN